MARTPVAVWGDDLTDWAAAPTYYAVLVDLVAVRQHRTCTNLHPLTNSTYSSELLTTRLGAPNIRGPPVWTDANGRHWIHPAQHTPRTQLPRRVRPDDRDTIRRLMSRAIPIPKKWISMGRPGGLTVDPATHIPGGGAKTRAP
ncbi:hypothetical protein [Streptomyces thermolilacinus]|uniref:Uncharacterized protein n=1 Tax=Streptomyces thermolilacinus SPC6 TaxID=1306406 RepID=A0A1D3DMB8_9ACTN|nr:hypothetical protein [Streptomyces thermolilacinus]OEJ93468.1 hypothetical protein J116_002300 [Streptomyces thermolilacinus SPC6]